MMSGLPTEVLLQIWALADVNGDDRLDLRGYLLCCWLVRRGVQNPNPNPHPNPTQAQALTLTLTLTLSLTRCSAACRSSYRRPPRCRPSCSHRPPPRWRRRPSRDP